jgi:[ribosomal protein S5]-alanine N-acetyltransferase
VQDERDVIATGPRLSLARFTQGDFDAVHAFASDAEVCRYTTWGPNSESDTKSFLDQAVIERSDQFLLATLVDGRVIGSAAVWTTSAADLVGEFGYTIARPYWGQGYATEVAALLLRLGFNDLGLERLAATCDPQNGASIRVLEKAGLMREGHLRGHVVARGHRRDSLLFGCLASDFPRD